MVDFLYYYCTDSITEMLGLATSSYVYTIMHHGVSCDTLRSTQLLLSFEVAVLRIYYGLCRITIVLLEHNYTGIGDIDVKYHVATGIS